MTTTMRRTARWALFASRAARLVALAVGVLLVQVAPLHAREDGADAATCALCEDCSLCPACDGCEEPATPVAQGSEAPVAPAAALVAEAPEADPTAQPVADAGEPGLLSLEGFPYGAVGGLLASAIAAGLVWAPLALPIGCYVVAMTAGSAASTWMGIGMLAGLLIVPASALGTVVVVALAPLAVGAGSMLDAFATGRRRWPGVVGAAAGWLVLGAGAVAGGAGVVALMVPNPAGPVLALAGVGASAASLALAPLASLAGAVAADRWLGGELGVE